MTSSKHCVLVCGPIITILVVACGESRLTETGPEPPVLEIVSGDHQAGPAGSELPHPLVVRVHRDGGRPLKDQVVNFRVTDGDGSIFAGVAITDRSGIAQDRWTLGPIPGAQQIVEARAVDTETGAALTFATFTATALPPAVAHHLVFSVQPTDAHIDEAISPAVQVEIQDAHGGLVTAARDPVTLEIGDDPGGGSLSGTRTVNAIAGVASFSGLSIDRAGQGYTLMASAPNLLGAASAPFTILGVTAAMATVSVGAESACGLTSDLAFCWGWNGFGQLGDGSAVDRSTPVLVTGGLSFASIVAGRYQSCGIASDGAAWCWGRNNFGQLGDGSTTDSPVPVPVVGGLSVVLISTSNLHVCGLTHTGTAYCWGSNPFGELGDGTTTTRLEPVPVSGGLMFSTISAASTHTCGVTTVGQGYCWGNGSNGRLGTGTGSTSVPAPVQGGLTFASISSGTLHSCGLTNDGTAYCWGNDSFGELGNGATGGSATPVPVAGGLSIAQLDAGHHSTCGVTAAGDGYCWGENNFGQLGDGSTTNRDAPTLISGGLTFSRVETHGHSTAGERSFSCGVTTTGETYCWGDGRSGQLGNGSTDGSPTPVLVSTP